MLSSIVMELAGAAADTGKARLEVGRCVAQHEGCNFRGGPLVRPARMCRCLFPGQKHIEAATVEAVALVDDTAAAAAAGDMRRGPFVGAADDALRRGSVTLLVPHPLHQHVEEVVAADVDGTELVVVAVAATEALVAADTVEVASEQKMSVVVVGPHFLPSQPEAECCSCCVTLSFFFLSIRQ